MWNWYLGPATEKAKKKQAAERGEVETDGMSDEQLIGMLQMMGVVGPMPDKEKTDAGNH